MVLRDDCLNSRRRHCVNRRTCCHRCTNITARHMNWIHGDHFMACALHCTWHRNYVGRTIHYDERREPEYVRQTMPRMHSFGRVCSHDEKHLYRWVGGLRGFQGVDRISKALPANLLVVNAQAWAPIHQGVGHGQANRRVGHDPFAHFLPWLVGHHETAIARCPKWGGSKVPPRRPTRRTEGLVTWRVYEVCAPSPEQPENILKLPLARATGACYSHQSPD